MSTVATAERDLVDLLAAECKNTGDVQSLLKRLFGQTVENLLEADRR